MDPVGLPGRPWRYPHRRRRTALRRGFPWHPEGRQCRHPTHDVAPHRAVCRIPRTGRACSTSLVRGRRAVSAPRERGSAGSVSANLDRLPPRLCRQAHAGILPAMVFLARRLTGLDGSRAPDAGPLPGRGSAIPVWLCGSWPGSRREGRRRGVPRTFGAV